jgi:Family of unknown function (DUF5681)
MADNSKDQRVGYKHPPKKSQFPPGVSGNPSGRPRASRTWQRDLRDELNELVRTAEGEITKQRAILKALVANAIEGDPRAIAVLLSTCARALSDESNAEHDKPPPAEEFEILRDFVAKEERRRAAEKRQVPEVPTQSTSKGVTDES